MGSTGDRLATAERLRAVRRDAGYRTGSDAARAFGWVVGTYLSHENGNRGLDLETVDRYAAAFRVDPAVILRGAAARAAPAPAARATEPARPRLDESRLAELIQSALVVYANMPGSAAAQVAASLLAQARGRPAPPADAPAPAHAPDTPVLPAPVPGSKAPT
jgi:hypothetical protein